MRRYLSAFTFCLHAREGLENGKPVLGVRDGLITDEARRRIERELDLEEASIACKKEGGVEPPP